MTEESVHGDTLHAGASVRLDAACPECSTAVTSAAQRCPHCGHLPADQSWDNIDALGDPWLGRVIGERYRIKRLVGRGASGTVYEAQSLSIGRSFATKIINFSDTDVPDGVTRAETRFEREIETLETLRNPHIVSIYELLRPADDVVAIVMDLVAGRTVREIVTQDGPIEPNAAIELLRQVANGLYEAHEAGIVHRDIKPANLMVEELPAGDLFVHILDFGAVLRAGEDSDLTQGFVGTPLFTSPEQARGRDVDRRADIYSLGATVFYMLTGRPPFEAESTFRALHAHLEEEPPRLSVVSDFTIPPEFDDLMARALAKDPERRPETLASFIRQLNRVRQVGRAGPALMSDVEAGPAGISESSVSAATVLREDVSTPDEDDGFHETLDDSFVMVATEALDLGSLVDASMSERQFAVLEQGGRVHVVDTAGGEGSTMELDVVSAPRAVDIVPGAVFVGDDEGCVYERDIDSSARQLFSGPSSPVTALVACSKGRHLVVGSADGSVILLDTETTGRGRIHRIPSDVPVTAVTLCRGYTGFAVCRADASVTLHSFERPDVPVLEFEAADVVEAAALSADAHLLAAATRGSTLEIYHPDTGGNLLPATSLREEPLALAFDRQDRLHAVCEIGGALYRWNLQAYLLASDPA